MTGDHGKPKLKRKRNLSRCVRLPNDRKEAGGEGIDRQNLFEIYKQREAVRR